MFDVQAMTRCHHVLCEVLAALREGASEAYLIGGWAIYFTLRHDSEGEEISS